MFLNHVDPNLRKRDVDNFDTLDSRIFPSHRSDESSSSDSIEYQGSQKGNHQRSFFTWNISITPVRSRRLEISVDDRLNEFQAKTN